MKEGRTRPFSFMWTVLANRKKKHVVENMSRNALPIIIWMFRAVFRLNYRTSRITPAGTDCKAARYALEVFIFR